MLLAEGKALATAELSSPAPGFWPMWRRAGWLRKREDGRPPPWPPEAPSKTLLPPSRLERGSWPPLAARAGCGKEKRKKLQEYFTFIIFQHQNYLHVTVLFWSLSGKFLVYVASVLLFHQTVQKRKTISIILN